MVLHGLGSGLSQAPIGVGGGLTAKAGASVLGGVAAGMAGGYVAPKIAKEFGASQDTQDFVGAVAGALPIAAGVAHGFLSGERGAPGPEPVAPNAEVPNQRALPAPPPPAVEVPEVSPALGAGSDQFALPAQAGQGITPEAPRYPELNPDTAANRTVPNQLAPNPVPTPSQGITVDPDGTAQLNPRQLPADTTPVTHPLGAVTGIDHQSGLPIVDRTQAPAESKPAEPAKGDVFDRVAQPATSDSSTGLQAPKPEAPPAPEPAKPSTTLAIGQKVTTPSGQEATVKFLAPERGIVRVRTDDGRKLNLPQSQLTPVQEKTNEPDDVRSSNATPAVREGQRNGEPAREAQAAGKDAASHASEGRQEGNADGALQGADRKEVVPSAPENRLREPEATPAGSAEARTPESASPETGLEHRPASGEPAKGMDGLENVRRMPIDELHLDPKRFQYKVNKDEKTGAGDSLEGVQKWNDSMADSLNVWHDPVDGKTYVVNGHHRTALAKRFGVPDIAIKEMAGVHNAAGARARGALINIAQGKGTAIDAAKFFRDSKMSREDVEKEGVPMKDSHADDGLAMSRLSDPLFHQVVTGKMPQGRAIAIGNAAHTHEQQDALVAMIDKAEARGKTVTNATIDELGRMVHGSGTHTETQNTLFGAESRTRNLALEKAEVSSYIRGRIGSEKKLFAHVADKNRASQLGEAGNKINVKKSAAIAEKATQAQEVYDKLSTRTGEIDDILNQAASALAKGGNDGETKAAAYRQAREALSRAISGREEASPAGSEAGSGKQQGISGKDEAGDEPAPVSKAELEAAGQNAMFALRRKGVRPEDSFSLPGMDDDIKAQDASAAEVRGEELSKAFAEPHDDISKAAGEMEKYSPLFRDTEANPQPGLFKLPATERMARVAAANRNFPANIDRGRFELSSTGEKQGDRPVIMVDDDMAAALVKFAPQAFRLAPQGGHGWNAFFANKSVVAALRIGFARLPRGVGKQGAKMVDALGKIMADLDRKYDGAIVARPLATQNLERQAMSEEAGHAFSNRHGLITQPLYDKISTMPGVPATLAWLEQQGYKGQTDLAMLNELVAKIGSGELGVEPEGGIRKWGDSPLTSDQASNVMEAFLDHAVALKGEDILDDLPTMAAGSEKVLQSVKEKYARHNSDSLARGDGADTQEGSGPPGSTSGSGPEPDRTGLQGREDTRGAKGKDGRDDSGAGPGKQLTLFSAIPDALDRFKDWTSDSLDDGDLQRETRGQFDRRIAVAAEQLEGARKAFRIRPRAESLKFIDAAEGVIPMSSLPAKDQKLAATFKDEPAPVSKAELEAAGQNAMFSLTKAESKPDEAGSVAPTFYLKGDKIIDAKMKGPMPGTQVLRMLENNGVKPDEIQWTGIGEYLKDKKLVRPEQVKEALQQGMPQMKEVTKGDVKTAKPLPKPEPVTPEQLTVKEHDLQWYAENPYTKENQAVGKGTVGSKEEAATYLARYMNTINKEKHQQSVSMTALAIERSPARAKFAKYQEPGGENYREMLMTLPPTAEFDHAHQVEMRRVSVEARNAWRAAKENHDLKGTTESRNQVGIALKRMHNAEEAEATYIRERAQSDYKSSHWEEKNVLAHVRFNDRTSADGKKLLHLEEIQSDWHQQGRDKGYKGPVKSEEALKQILDNAGYEVKNNGTNWVVTSKDGSPVPNKLAGGEGKNQFASDLAQVTAMVTGDRTLYGKLGSQVPDAPFKKTWHEMALRRMLRHAAENGYDGLSWTPGEKQNARYSLSHQVSELNVFRHHDGSGYDLSVKKMEGGSADVGSHIPAEKLPDYVGKEMAQKIVDDNQGTLDARRQSNVGGKGEWKKYSGLDLQVGGSGMKGFYDKIVPDYLNKYGKQWGAQVGEAKLTMPEHLVEKEPGQFGYPAEPPTMHTQFLPITDAMRKSVVEEGQPMFALDKDGAAPGWSEIGTGDGGQNKSLVEAMRRTEAENIAGVSHDIIPATKDTAPVVRISDDAMAILVKGPFEGRQANAVHLEKTGADWMVEALKDAGEEKLSALSVAIDQNRSRSGGAIIIRAGMHPDSYAHILGEEHFHDAQITNGLKSDSAPAQAARNASPDAWDRLAHYLNGVGYKPDEVNIEIPAKIASGQGDFLGLSKPEANDILNAYLKAVAKEKGSDTLKQFPVHEAMRDAIPEDELEKSQKEEPDSPITERSRVLERGNPERSGSSERGTGKDSEPGDSSGSGLTKSGQFSLGPDALDRFKDWTSDSLDDGDLQRGIQRETRGQFDRRIAVAAEQLEGARKAFRIRPRAESLKFIDAAEGVIPMSSLPAKDQKLAATFKEKFDETTKAIQAYKPNVLENYIENYFPHIWEQPSKAASIFRQVVSGKKPFAGSGSFLKQRTIPTTADGLAMGLKPVSYNPVDLFLLKYAEMGKFLMAQQTVDMMEKSGTAKMIRVGQKAPDGWQRLDDRLGTKYAKDDNDHLFVAGNYYAPPAAAKVFNNYVSKGIAGRSRIFDAIQSVNSNMNAFQLGISAFHATTTTVNNAISTAALGTQELTHGKVKGALHLAEGFTVLPALAHTIVNGSRLMKEYLNPGSYAKMAGEANALALAGGRLRAATLEIKPLTQFLDNLRNHDWGGAAKKTIPALIDATSRPIMEQLVPRVKAGAFQQMASNILDTAGKEGWSQEKTRARMQKAWDSIDNRFGQMVYDNLFWHKAMRDVLNVSTRSVGWNGGSFREGFGAAADTAKQTAKAATGKMPELTDRMAFSLMLPIVTGLIGGSIYYMLNHEMPHDWKDYFYPGKKGEARMSIPGYFKDVVSFSNHPGQTVLNKMSPLFSSAGTVGFSRDVATTTSRAFEPLPRTSPTGMSPGAS
jgi:hypothetical protein